MAHKINNFTCIVQCTILTGLMSLLSIPLVGNTNAADIANVETPYIPYNDKPGTIDVVFCSENNYFRSSSFTLGYACYKAIDERSEGFGTRLDLERNGDYAIFELPAVSTINRMELIFYKGHERQYDITIQVANAGAHVQGDELSVQWRTIFNGKTPNVGGTETNPDPVVLNFNNVEGQFIRIIGKGAYADGKLTTPLNQHTSIRELQIFGQKGDEVYTYSNQGTSTDALNPQKMSPTNDNQNVGSSGDYGDNSKAAPTTITAIPLPY